jgi:hypothetical protein
MFTNQFGFRPNKRSWQAIGIVTKQVYTNIDEGKKCDTIYLDLTKSLLKPLVLSIIINFKKNVRHWRYQIGFIASHT